MNRFPEDLFSPGMIPEQLAARVLEHAFDTRVPSIPVDPFKLMKDYGIIYQFMDFKDLEGIYLVPADENDIAVAGINYRRPITRQRFTAAHELCHHIKDRRNEACPKSGKNSIEKYADRFAAELLMPADLFHRVAMEYADGGKVSFDDALIIAERFGVSFQSCVLRLAYRFNMIDEDYTKLNKLIKDFKPDIQKKKRGIDLENIDLLRQAVDSYTFFSAWMHLRYGTDSNQILFIMRIGWKELIWTRMKCPKWWLI